MQPEPEIPEDALQLGDFTVDRTLQLASGGTLRLKIQTTIMLLNSRDRRFVFTMMELLNRYADDVGEEAFEIDG